MGFEIDLIAAKLRRETIMKRQMPIRDRTALSVEIEGLSKATSASAGRSFLEGRRAAISAGPS